MDSVRVEQLEREGLVKVTWLPFELHPEAPVEGIPRDVYFGRERAERMDDYMQSVAKSVGLTMKRRDVIINSRRALGAAEFARDHGMFGEMHRVLLKAHWEGSGRLEDVDDLVRIGEEVGLDASELRKAIEDGRYEATIDEYRRDAEGAGINAIPAHIFGRRYLVLGAQPYDVFKQVLDQLHAGQT
ncbi:MAG TPA: DsbA family protein [Candidatus Dormibacteraeota bacterium]|nr:DsbA family protein [Candidatus Dormibacteraeota bacterium]